MEATIEKVRLANVDDGLFALLGTIGCGLFWLKVFHRRLQYNLYVELELKMDWLIS